MLQELIVENFALIDRLRLELGPGFTVLSGETGAGKSIIIDALGAALGERVGADSIRHGAEKALVEAVFEARDCPRARAALVEAGLAEDDDPTIVLTRQIADGRSSYRLNHRPATLALLEEVGGYLVDIHGQHQHQQLIHEEYHLQFLDNYGAERYGELAQEYARGYQEFAAARRALENSRLSERERAVRVDMLRFQVEELEQAALQPNEDEALQAQRLRLTHSEKLREATEAAAAALEGDGTAVGAVDALLGAGRSLSATVALDPALGPLAEEMEQVGLGGREVARSLRDYLASLEHDPRRLEAVQARLSEITRLKRKYNATLEEVLNAWDQAALELQELERSEHRSEELVQRLEALRRSVGAVAEKLSAARRKAADKLAKLVERELAGLGMPAASFAVELERQPDPEGLLAADGTSWSADGSGIDRCRFLLSANQGEQVRPLAHVASGGELSRLMLVFKSLSSRAGEIPTIIFDEIDAGIGGLTAHAVARKLAEVSRRAQVLCVTHLPQIARLANNQIYVGKAEEGGRTVVRTTPVEGEQRVAEIVRMLGDSGEREAAYQHAAEMLQEAERERAALAE